MSAAPEPIEHLLRELAPQVLGSITRRFRDFSAAEDAVQEALLAAALKWPRDGLPENPRAWLIQVAARRRMDQIREETARRRREDRAAPPVETHAPDPDTVAWPDDTLVLLFLCCHPALSAASAIALTLRAVGGLTTAEIARAFLVPEATMAQRISRAKQSIRSSGVAFQMPGGDERAQRLKSVLHVLYLMFNEGYVASAGPDLQLSLIHIYACIRDRSSGVAFQMPGGDERAQRLKSVLHVLYLMFNEGYVASAGPDLQRPDLTREAIRLTRVLHRLMPEEAEVSGLLALMLLTDARRSARTGPAQELIPLAEQDRSLWDAGQISEGIALLTAALPKGSIGPYQLQAAISAVHAEAARAEETDWPQILALYDLLRAMSGSPIVMLNHAVATAMVRGPSAGLELLDCLEREGHLAGHHRFYAVRAHLREMAGDTGQAVADYSAAADRTSSQPERIYLLARAARLTSSSR